MAHARSHDKRPWDKKSGEFIHCNLCRLPVENKRFAVFQHLRKHYYNDLISLYKREAMEKGYREAKKYHEGKNIVRDARELFSSYEEDITEYKKRRDKRRTSAKIKTNYK